MRVELRISLQSLTYFSKNKNKIKILNQFWVKKNHVSHAEVEIKNLIKSTVCTDPYDYLFIQILFPLLFVRQHWKTITPNFNSIDVRLYESNTKKLFWFESTGDEMYAYVSAKSHTYKYEFL